MRRAALATMLALVAGVGPGAAAGPDLAVEAKAPPAVPLADAFDYVVEATVPASDAERAELVADVGPFTVLSAEPMEQERNGAVVVLRLTRRLACLGDGCVGKDESIRVVLPAPTVTAARGVRTGRPSVVVVRGRLAPASVRPSPDEFRADTTVPPPGGTRPETLAAVLALIGGAAVVVAVVLLALAAVARRRGGPVDPLARAIRLVRESAGRPEEDRRRAADLLARTAGRRDRSSLAAEATRVAWAPARPTADSVEELAGRATREAR